MSALPIIDAHAHSGARPAKVLVAEDHDDTRQMLRTLLERRGLSVVEARDGFEAVSAAERERPDLILMDGGLPRLDGVSVTRRLRKVPALSTVPIVFLSGHAGPQAQTAALDAGCDEYVVKPFDLARLDTVLSRHLRQREGGLHEDLNRPMTQAGIRTSAQGVAGLSRDDVPALKWFGLVELDPDGTVLYVRNELDGLPQYGAVRDYTGLNFYTEVAPFRNVVEFRQLLDGFSSGSQPAHSTDFTCDYEDGPLLVRVLLARIREQSQLDATKSVLVHIRRAQ